MIKLTPKYKTIPLSNILRKPKQKLPIVKTPLVSYLYFEEESEEERRIISGLGFGFGGLFSQAVKKYLDLSESQEEEQETLSFTQTETLTETKTETKLEIKESVQEETTYEPIYHYSVHKEPIIKRVFDTVVESIGDVISNTIEKFQDIKYLISDVIANFKYKRAERKEERRIQNALFERLKIEKLEAQRYELANKLEEYKSMFEPRDILPDLSAFSNSDNLPDKDLQHLSKVLGSMIDHQAVIQNIKERYRKGAGHYAEGDDEKNLRRTELHKIKPNYTFRNGKHYRNELKRLCELFLLNSKVVENPIFSFQNIVKCFFNKAKENLKEVFRIKKQTLFKVSERIPYLGIVPKSVRIADQMNLTQCILDDFDDITQRYVQNGVHPIMKKFNGQYDTIFSFTQRCSSSDEDKKYTDKMLGLINKARKGRNRTYARLYDSFVKGGLSIKNTCQNIRLKDGVSLFLKTIKLLSLMG